MTQDAQLSRFDALPKQVQGDLHLVMYWSEHYGTQAEANAVERLTDYFAQDIETVAESADLAALRQRVQELEADRRALIFLYEDGWPIDDIEQRIMEANKILASKGADHE